MFCACFYKNSSLAQRFCKRAESDRLWFRTSCQSTKQSICHWDIQNMSVQQQLAQFHERATMRVCRLDYSLLWFARDIMRCSASIKICCISLFSVLSALALTAAHWLVCWRICINSSRPSSSVIDWTHTWVRVTCALGVVRVNQDLLTPRSLSLWVNTHPSYFLCHFVVFGECNAQAIHMALNSLQRQT